MPRGRQLYVSIEESLDIEHIGRTAGPEGEDNVGEHCELPGWHVHRFEAMLSLFAAAAPFAEECSASSVRAANG